MMMKPDGFILGLSNGAACMAYCAPVLIPCLLGEGRGVVRNAWLTGEFLLGRLLGYMLFALLAAAVGRTILTGGSSRDILIGAAYVLFAGLLIVYGFFRRQTPCQTGCSMSGYRRILSSVHPALFPLFAGFATGLSFCPPFLLAFAGAAAQTGIIQSLLYFLSFFLGTSALFVFAPLVGALKGFSALKIIGQLAAGLMGIYYLYAGAILLTGGLIRL